MSLAAPGFPDLYLIHPRHGIIYAELKSETGTLSDDQRIWRDRLLGAGQTWHLWRPRHLDDIVIPALSGEAVPVALSGLEGEWYPYQYVRFVKSISPDPGPSDD